MDTIRLDESEGVRYFVMRNRKLCKVEKARHYDIAVTYTHECTHLHSNETTTVNNRGYYINADNKHRFDLVREITEDEAMAMFALGGDADGYDI